MEITRNHLGLLLFLFLLLSSRASVTGVSDLLNKGSNITDGNTLVSAGGSFILGFFSPGVSTKRYLGIWFSVSNSTVCWVANRERPLNSRAGVLVFSSNTGNLILIDGSGQTVWTSNFTTTRAVPGVAQLHESGNLVIREQTGQTIVWQSFDDPSDTLLPGMKMGKNLWAKTEWYLSSWRSADDPSPAYRFVTEVNGLPDNVLWDGSTRAYRTGPWNGLRFSGTTEATTYTNMFRFVVTINPSEVTFGYTAVPGAPLSRIVATYSGMVKRLVWEASRQRWETFLQGPRDVCDAYAMCGPFGLCNNAPSTSFCSCPRGFTPASPSEWSLRENSGGCRRSAALDCTQGNGSTSTSSTDGFMVLQGVKLPDTYNASVDASATLEECRARCFANCSCVAYAPADIRVGAGTGCIIWTGNITDLRYVDGGQALYLRLPKSELGGPSLSMFPTGIVIGVSVALIIIMVLAFWVFTRRRRHIQRVLIRNGLRVTADDVAPDDHRPNLPSPMTSVPSIDLPTIREATGNFSGENKFGEVGFSIVYKGQLPVGTVVAVKRLKERFLTDKGKRDFLREVEVMSTLTHVNLVKLLYHCQEGDEWILVYEYMKNMSLNFYIFGGQNRPRSSLNWAQRLDIIHGIAIGVEYLHGEGVIHRDLKPGNVLLSDTWESKIADFTTAKLFIEEQTDPTLVLTPGYVAPEYSGEGALTYKCDVYSFGVVLLEIVSGKRRTSNATFLPDAWESWSRCEPREFLDLELDEPEGELLSGLARCIQIGLLCVQHSAGDRPAMSEVVVMLTNTSSQLTMPKKPTPNRGAGPGIQLILDDTPGPSRAF